MWLVVLGRILSQWLRISRKLLLNKREIGKLSDYVVSPMGKLDRQIVRDLMPRFVDASEIWLREGVVGAMNKHNGST